MKSIFAVLLVTQLLPPRPTRFVQVQAFQPICVSSPKFNSRFGSLYSTPSGARASGSASLDLDGTGTTKQLDVPGGEKSTPPDAVPKDVVDAARADVQRRTEERDQKTVVRDVTSVAELDELFDGRHFLKPNGKVDYDTRLRSIRVIGDTQRIGSPDHPDFVHPVAKLLHERRRNGYSVETRDQSQSQNDTSKIALVVEGGGMRG